MSKNDALPPARPLNQFDCHIVLMGKNSIAGGKPLRHLSYFTQMTRARPAIRKQPKLAPALSPRRVPWLSGIALFLLTVLVYIPSINNRFIWDDPQYVVDNPTLKSAEGLWQIWTDPTSVPQYYPMVHTTFWIEARLWGTNSAAGYHVDNILLHALAGILLWQVLVTLKLPWPWLAAAIFAVHPVMVESVAWVTERKNVLSIVFYLLAIHAYFGSGLLDIHQASGVDPPPIRRGWYLASLLLFLLALFSKTVTCSLPAAVLLIVWWKRGKLTWRDIRPLLPMFVIGVLLSLLTSHLEQTQVGARGPDFDWSPIDRVLIAGHSLCFYAVKLLWPYPLIFMYPKWDLQADRAWQFIYPGIVAVTVLALWVARRRIGRGPLVAVLFFTGTLLPALGFVNVYPMRYSFVADHFQYLASIGLIVLFAGGLQLIANGISAGSVPRNGLAIVILAPLAWITWHQQYNYKDARTLWENTIAQNETCWMAHVNLGAALRVQNEMDAAMAQSKRALDLAPNEADTQRDYAMALQRRGQWSAAADRLRMAIQLDARCAPAWSDLARLLWDHGNTPTAQLQAVHDAEQALAIQPNLADSHYVLARFAEIRGDLTAAIAEYGKSLAINDADFYAHYNLGNCLLATGHPGEAAGEFLRVLKHDPRNARALTNLGAAYLKAGHEDDAVACFQRALRIDPNLTQAKQNLAAMQRKN